MATETAELVFPVARRPPPSGSGSQAIQWILAQMIGVVEGSVLVYMVVTRSCSCSRIGGSSYGQVV